MQTQKSSPWINNQTFRKVLYPAVVAIVVVLLWQGWVSYFKIPQFLVPSPVVMLQSLWTNLGSLTMSLLFTLKITLISF